MNIICFHNPEEENGFLSNWYLSDFKVNEVKYSSMEQFMMYKKAIRFQDIEKAQQILSTNDVALIKEYGRQVKGYNDSIWCGVRQMVVYQGLLAKFSQNNILCNKLLQTHNDILAECAVKDRVWGIGLSMNDPERLDLAKWRGQNLLGYTLMMVREELR
ncbi:MAG TPA: DUF1768 domain-containing protein [Eubacterium sp.]|nr:DUF1768 domain-containing protein [Eubacterium sp.]